MQSVAGISRRSALSGDRIRQCETSSESRHKDTHISVCKSPFPSAGTAVSLFRAKTVQQRPLLPREVETWLFYHRMMHCTDCAVARCLLSLCSLSGCLSVTRRYCVKRAINISSGFFRTKCCGNILTGTPKSVASNTEVWYEKIAIFNEYLALCRKRYTIGDVNSYVIYRTAPVSLTLSDLEWLSKIFSDLHSLSATAELLVNYDNEFEYVCK